MQETDENTKHIVGNAGLYYVCFKLSKLYWNVMPTSRNARGIDVVCINVDGSQTFTAQVKSMRNRNAVSIGTNLDNIMGDYWIIVNGLASCKPETYILCPNDIRARSTHYSDGVYWLGIKQYAVKEFKEKWERIGNGLQTQWNEF